MDPQAVLKGPDAFRTISEVAEDLDLPQHVLRFWETRFTQIKPMKRGGGRRYYRPEDVELLRGIRVLLYGEGFTIRGVQRLLKEKGVAYVATTGRNGTTAAVLPEVADPIEAAEPAEDWTDAPALEDVTEPLLQATAPVLPERPVIASLEEEDERVAAAIPVRESTRRVLESALGELKEVKRMLDQAAAR